MSARPDRPSQRGFTLIELMMGTVVFVVAALVLGNHITSNYATTAMQRDKVFAFSRAQAILAEIHSMVDRGSVEDAIDLDVLDDGVTTRPALTIAEDANGNLVLPDHPLSGNFARDGEWQWSRRISVRPFQGLSNRSVRYVTVRILKRDGAGREHEVASLSSVVNSVGSAFPATQVFDVYLLAIESIPGWWVFMESIVPFVESAITDLESRNPGLSVRTHWITKAGFGRDRAYRPFINDENDSHEDVPSVYYYPGAMPVGNASNYYYVPDLMKARIAVDGTEQNGWDEDLNRYPYALADWYNHAMRYPQARELHEKRRDAVLERAEDIRQAALLGVQAPDPLEDMSVEPPLQVLLEDMASNPDAYRHALLINLHGELLPVPPLRNYSDPAKLPEELPGVRVVTHPEELRTQSPVGAPSGVTTDVRLRVYAYMTNEDWKPSYGVMPDDHPILVEVMDMDLTDGSNSGLAASGVSIENLAGGVFVDGDSSYYSLRTAKNRMVHSLENREMSYTCWYIDRGTGQRKSTLFVLYSTPVIAPAQDQRGLYQTERARPYNLAYVPGPVEGARDFSRDLASTGDGPKNTARWVITIPSSTWNEARFRTPEGGSYDPRSLSDPDVTLTVRTRIHDANGGQNWWDYGTWPNGTDNRIVEPQNLSETYTWWASTREAVPFTERSQFLGDPRHNPYKDLLSGDPDFGDGYNWFFDSLSNNSENSKSDHPGIVRTWNRWNNGPRFDVPRFMELYRTAIVGSRAIYTTLSGYSNYYVGIGNEIGYDSSNGYPNSIPVSLRPWGGASGTTGHVNNITYARALVRDYQSNGEHWWGMPWLGELYPDNVFDTQWMAVDAQGHVQGNLPAGWPNFRRADESAVYTASVNQAFGTAMLNSHHRTDTRGCVSFFNNGSSSAHFNHHFQSGTGSLVGPGIEIAENYGFPIPAQTSINRPFSVATGNNTPPEYGSAPYNSNRFHIGLTRQFYNHPGGNIGSGLVQFEPPNRSQAAWVVINGIAETTTSGSSFLAKYCLLSMFQSYFELGDPNLAFRIEQPPRVEIMAPTEISEIVDPAQIEVQFETDWLRWDRLAYTAGTSANFAEDESRLEYAIYYSPDNGITWRHAQDDSPAVIGQLPSDPQHVVADQGTGAEVYSWATPSGQFPEGSYLVRVEAYRRGRSMHYSVHQTRFYVER
ncbi:MAG: type II secretion system protein [Planctomycetota bacterium]